MFKANEIKKALIAVCNHPSNFATIAAKKVNSEQADKVFVRGYASKLFSYELLEYLNDNRSDDFALVAFEHKKELGDLGDMIETLKEDGGYDVCFGSPLTRTLLGTYPNKLAPRTEQVCLVGVRPVFMHNTAALEEKDGKTDIDRTTFVAEETYITETGKVLTFRCTSCCGLVIRMPDPSIIPCLDNVKDYLGNPDSDAEDTEETEGEETDDLDERGCESYDGEGGKLKQVNESEGENA